MMAELRIPALSLVLLIGVSGSGKSTFGRAHFQPTEVISSDFCRGVVADDENDQAATKQAFQLLHYIVGMRLAAGRLTVVDATNVQPDARGAARRGQRARRAGDGDRARPADRSVRGAQRVSTGPELRAGRDPAAA